MKAIIYDIKGDKKEEISLPTIFSTKIREDIVAKCFEAEKIKHPYSPYSEAGRRHSASGTISHQRHDWKGHYGKGISRVPRKTMWRRGTQFYWIGAEISSARGGRRAHPPKPLLPFRKINKKEFIIAMNSAFASTGDAEYVLRRYDTLNKLEIKTPIILESKIEGIKTKEIILLMKKILGNAFAVALKKKRVKPGKNKRRIGKYKSNAGLLIIKGKNEKILFSGFDIKSVDEIKFSDLYPLGRLSIYTENAIKEMGEKK